MAGGRRLCPLPRYAAQKPQYAPQQDPTPFAAFFRKDSQMFGPMMGVPVPVPAIGMMGRGAEQIEVDAVHGFRSGLGSLVGMPENLCYFESGISLKRKLSLRYALA